MYQKIRQYLSLALAFLVFTSVSHAQVYSLENIKSSQEQHSSFETSKRILSEMDKPEIQAQIRDLGIDVEEAKVRIAALSDKEIEAAMAGENQAGGEVVVISLTTLLVVVIILLLID